MTDRVLRIGVLGLSRGLVLMRPTFLADPRCRLVAAADPRPEARAAFEAEFAARSYETAEALCEDPEVGVVYIASPHQHHAAQAILAARHGKHVLVEKPMALGLADCAAMQAAARKAGVHLIVGPSHSYDAPVACAAWLNTTPPPWPVSSSSGRRGRYRKSVNVMAVIIRSAPCAPLAIRSAAQYTGAS